jgi:periplasmic divalent cation tolerance protein
VRVVLCNCPPDAAEGIARALVSEGLAACVNVIPGVRSLYLWDGTLQEDAESTLLIKVAAERVGELAARARELHPYELPEIVALDVDVASSDPRYVAWVRSTARKSGGP